MTLSVLNSVWRCPLTERLLDGDQNMVSEVTSRVMHICKIQASIAPSSTISYALHNLSIFMLYYILNLALGYV